MESEFFGHRKGSFTGAVSDKAGLFQSAEGGTLFLDEIGEMHPTAQAKLLRVLEDHTIDPLGLSGPRKVGLRAYRSFPTGTPYVQGGNPLTFGGTLNVVANEIKYKAEVVRVLAVVDREHVGAEGVLQLGVLVEVVQHHVGELAPLELDHHAHARLVGLVADVGNALDLLVVDQLGLGRQAVAPVVLVDDRLLGPGEQQVLPEAGQQGPVGQAHQAGLDDPRARANSQTKE